ncbi:MAG: hypothetical protein Kow00107_11320 [Planctomycetota bacterium]
MKVFRFIILVVLVGLVVLIAYSFVYFNSMKATPEWYVEPPAMPTQLADAILSRANTKFETAYKDAAAGLPFTVGIDYRALESYLLINHDKDLAANGIERPQLVKAGNELRLSAKITKGPLAGAVIYTLVKLEPTPEGNLLITTGRIMSGNKPVPGFVVSRVEKAIGMKIGSITVKPQDFDINAKLIDIKLDEDEAVFTLRKTK